MIVAPTNVSSSDTPPFQQQIPKHFTESLIESLARVKLGLGHVSSQDQALLEHSQGFRQGCSLSLAPKYCEFTYHESDVDHITLFQPLFRPYGEEPLKREQIFPVDKSKFTTCFERGVNDFIKGSLNYDLARSIAPIALGQTTVREIAQVVNFCCLSIVSYDATNESPCDQQGWGRGLGRFRKSNIEAKNIFPMPIITLPNLKYAPEELSHVVSTEKELDDVFIRMVDCYRSAVIEKLSSLLYVFPQV